MLMSNLGVYWRGEGGGYFYGIFMTLGLITQHFLFMTHSE